MGTRRMSPEVMPTLMGAGNTITVRNQPTRSTQPCIPPGSLNRVPGSAGVKTGMSPLKGWHVNSSGDFGQRTAISDVRVTLL